MNKNKGPKILVLDIETKPLLVYCWGLFDQNIGLNQIVSDWNVLSFSAKWYKDSKGRVYGPHDKMMYFDLSSKRDKTDDKELLKRAWNLLDECDILLTQNGIRFDNKKLNARFALHEMDPPSPFKHIDTLVLMKKNFALTSNKLEYASNSFCKKYTKQTKRKYAGFELWKECLAGNQEAWAEMKKYNCYDVLALEELYQKLSKWDNVINFNLYTDSNEVVCNCGSKNFLKKGFFYSSVGRFQRYKCKECGAPNRSRENLLSKEKKKSIRVKSIS